jgi:hypothetical protein
MADLGERRDYRSSAACVTCRFRTLATIEVFAGCRHCEEPARRRSKAAK